jgi:hypothetical protein
MGGGGGIIEELTTNNEEWEKTMVQPAAAGLFVLYTPTSFIH